MLRRLKQGMFTRKRLPGGNEECVSRVPTIVANIGAVLQCRSTSMCVNIDRHYRKPYAGPSGGGGGGSKGMGSKSWTILLSTALFVTSGKSQAPPGYVSGRPLARVTSKER